MPGTTTFLYRGIIERLQMCIRDSSGAMTLTERVYTHLDIETLVEAINKI